MCITADEFQATADDLVEAMNDVGIAYTFPSFDGGLAGDVLVLTLLSMESDIVEDLEGDGCPEAGGDTGTSGTGVEVDTAAEAEETEAGGGPGPT